MLQDVDTRYFTQMEVSDKTRMSNGLVPDNANYYWEIEEHLLLLSYDSNTFLV
jgi:hypothetical protein